MHKTDALPPFWWWRIEFLVPGFGSLFSKEEFCEKGNDVPEEYWTLEQFAERSNVKPETVKRRIKDIPGVEYVDRKYRVIPGTRYPMKKNCIGRAKTAGNQCVSILKALNLRCYIDGSYLDIGEKDFSDILAMLKDNDFIKPNESLNQYGSNGYDITLAGCDYLKDTKHKENMIKQATIRDVISLIQLVVSAASGVASCL